jgi:hypothetical protein
MFILPNHVINEIVVLFLQLIISAIMPSTIISPSVLASDFGQLAAECKRMIKGGAQWLHMGAFNLVWIHLVDVFLLSTFVHEDVMDG